MNNANCVISIHSFLNFALITLLSRWWTQLMLAFLTEHEKILGPLNSTFGRAKYWYSWLFHSYLKIFRLNWSTDRFTYSSQVYRRHETSISQQVACRLQILHLNMSILNTLINLPRGLEFSCVYLTLAINREHPVRFSPAEYEYFFITPMVTNAWTWLVIPALAILSK